MVPGNARECAELWEREASRLVHELYAAEAKAANLASEFQLLREGSKVDARFGAELIRRRDELATQLSTAKSEGMEAAVKILEKRIAERLHEHCVLDCETNVYEGPEWVDQLNEEDEAAATAIRAAKDGGS